MRLATAPSTMFPPPVRTRTVGARTVRARPMRALAALVTALVLATCTSGTEPGDDGDPTPGIVTYRLLSPNGTEGGLLVRAPADQVVSAGGGGDALTDVVSRIVGDDLYVAVLHRFGSASLGFELDVADTAAPPALTLLQVVGPDDRRRTLTGYGLEMVR